MSKISYPLLLGCCLFIFSSFIKGQNKTSISVYFEVNQHALSPDQEQQLRNFLTSFHGSGKLQIVGHTDSSATQHYNLVLSQKRAKTVQEFCLNQGIPTEKMEIDWKGEAEPQHSSKELSANRRVTLTLLPDPNSETATAGMVQNGKAEEEMRDMDWLLKYLASDWQEFMIDPKTNSRIETNGGLIFEIPANAFALRKNEPVKIIIQEYLTLGEMLANQMTTTSNGKLLETEGSFQILAIQGGDTLDLNLNQPITVTFPSDTLLPGMEIFEGEWNHAHTINWNRKGNGNGLAKRTSYPRFYGSNSPRFPQLSFMQRLFWGREREMRFLLGLSKKDTLPESAKELLANIKNSDGRKMSTRDALYSFFTEEEEADKANWDNAQKLDYQINSTFTIRRLGYINCDRYNAENTQFFTLNMQDHLMKDQYYLVLPRIRGIFPISLNNINAYFANVPDGENATLIKIRVKDDQFFMGQKEFKLNKLVRSISVPMVQMDESEIKSTIQKMNF